jgi:hypothetical protein
MFSLSKISNSTSQSSSLSSMSSSSLYSKKSSRIPLYQTRQTDSAFLTDVVVKDTAVENPVMSDAAIENSVVEDKSTDIDVVKADDSLTEARLEEVATTDSDGITATKVDTNAAAPSSIEVSDSHLDDLSATVESGRKVEHPEDASIALQNMSLMSAETAISASHLFDDASSESGHETSFSSLDGDFRRNFKISSRRRKNIDMKDINGIAALIRDKLTDLDRAHVAMHSNQRPLDTVGGRPQKIADGVIDGTECTALSKEQYRRLYLDSATDIVYLGRGIASAWLKVALSCSDKRLSQRLQDSLSKTDTLAAQVSD